MRYYTPNGNGYEIMSTGILVYHPDGTYFMSMSFHGFESYFGYDARKV